MQITIKNIDEKTFREFKAAAIGNGMKMGAAITLAMEKFKQELLRKKGKFTDLEPINWGKGTEHLSEEMDKILYGGYIMFLIDANFFIAHNNIQDIHHEKAKSLFSEIFDGKYGHYFTTDYVLNEVVGITFRKLGKNHALLVGNQIINTVFILNIDDHILNDSWKFFSQTKLNFNLVDCTNIIAIDITKTENIATFDKEFKKLNIVRVVGQD